VLRHFEEPQLAPRKRRGEGEGGDEGRGEEERAELRKREREGGRGDTQQTWVACERQLRQHWHLCQLLELGDIADVIALKGSGGRSLAEIGSPSRSVHFRGVTERSSDRSCRSPETPSAAIR